MEELALTLIGYLKEKYPGVLNARYEVSEEEENLGVLEGIARARGCLKKGEELDYAKASGIDVYKRQLQNTADSLKQ